LLKKGGGNLLAIPLIPLLLFSAASALVAHGTLGPSAPALPLIFQVDIPDGYFEYYQIDAAASANVVIFGDSSNVTVSTAFMDSTQFTAFNNTESGIVNSLFLVNGTSAQDTRDLLKGDYFLVFLASTDNANITFNWLLYPNSPFQTGPLTSPEPTGIGTFGLNNNSGVVTPYSIESNEVVGVADISSLLAHNSTASLANSTVSGATLQLNSVLVVNEANGTQQVYWVQNTPDFVTSALQVSDVDNVWNYSVSGFLSNTTITSTMGGYAYTYVQNNETQYFYADGTSNSTYALPFDIALMLNETVDPGVGVIVQTGTQILRNGTALESPADWFDNVTIHDSSVTSAYYFVSGNNTTPLATYYDTELIFGGEANGEATSFTHMSATLQLFYDSNSTGLLTYFPSYYSFGQDTAEAADNLKVTYNGDGVATLSVGTPDYVYMGSASGTSSLTQLEAAAATQSVSQSSSSSSGLSSFPLSFLMVVGLVTLTILAAEVGRRTSSRSGASLNRESNN
jgi:thermopsin